MLNWGLCREWYSLVPRSKASIFLKATLRLCASWTFPNIELYEGGGEDPENYPCAERTNYSINFFEYLRSYHRLLPRMWANRLLRAMKISCCAEWPLAHLPKYSLGAPSIAQHSDIIHSSKSEYEHFEWKVYINQAVAVYLHVDPIVQCVRQKLAFLIYMCVRWDDEIE